ncbi:adenylate/guanylate cyclase domain-containing protein [Kamptonema sp. UHCC 0994]|uniref:adenylate/guanylate cyclase domain-containing protein n=1 Tax=Kamptonema sp. UHCC 0994 TaxID=3031329 RepID=UPI0023B8C6D9|nr:adenylate/guanylate cyclase domain-containing protein [Kamptonema sp. UHCC 0994]MDF0553174.1 adenylate/guanylate cyclase domain-containing protein [Kamptonema sp. UHCC 0994]
MQPRILALLGSFKARLSLRISFWVFLSLIIIEIIILVPSYSRRENELLLQLEQVSSASINSLVVLTKTDMSDRKLFHAKIQNITSNSDVISGIAIYKSDGQLIDTLGEAPEIDFAELKNAKILRRRSRDGARYDVAWTNLHLGGKYILIVRHNATSVQQELYDFTLRIAGLVLIISIVVTSGTMLVLGITVISPILRLRDDLIAAGDALSKNGGKPDFYSLSVKREDELGEVMAAFNQMFNRVYQEINQRKIAEEILRSEQEKSERLLLNILPQPIAERLKQGQNNIADGFAEVTILFADIVGFTEISSRVSPQELVDLLNQIFSAFDRLSEEYGLEKIKTIGDNYMVAGGLPMPHPDHAELIAEMALDMQQEILRFSIECGKPLNIRIGINTGPVVAGVIGTKKFIYDLWGDAVNTASRMESQGIPGKIQVSSSTYKLLCDKYLFEERGIIQVKGKGEMTTYLLTGRKV